MRFLLLVLFITTISFGQTNSYVMSFDNTIHHEALITATFPELKTHAVTVRMSRTSPGRYALHEFAKNVFNLSASNSKGEALDIRRLDPYSWEITGHDGTVTITYTLFANRADGTYSQIDESHAHLNIPATFMYMEGTEERPIEVDFNLRNDLNWKVATQLKKQSETTYYAPNLYYFMDSPTEISDFKLREQMVDGQNIRFALHSPDTEQDLDTYWQKVIAIVEQEKAVFGELPSFDYGEYTFLACYAPHVSGDGMEHRNSTILTDSESLANGGMDGNIGTVSHEFFHAWNVERIRPYELEPFDFTAANMSEALWFAEGFTSYYTQLILARAGVITEEEYVKSLNGTFNYVWNSPARAFRNPIEMSHQAPFVDAARTVDPVNWNNTFISYYSYGSVLGLALDLSLREKGLNLDDYFKEVWNTYGKNEVAYTVENLEEVLSRYAGDAFAKTYFSKYIYNSEMPEYERLFKSVGLRLDRNETKPYLGLNVSSSDDGLKVSRATSKGTPAYLAGLNEGDLITMLNGQSITTKEDFTTFTNTLNVGATVEIVFERFGEEKKTVITVTSDPSYTISIDEKVKGAAKRAQKDWLARK